MIFTVVIASLPFYFMSLDLPKRIVNDAIQGRAFKDGHSSVIAFDWTLHLPDWLGGGSWRVSDGIALDQMGLLMALSAIFLGFVLINGAFKYWINVAKGRSASACCGGCGSISWRCCSASRRGICAR